MKVNQLIVNGQLSYKGRKYVILQMDPPTLTIKRIDTDGEAIEINFIDLITDDSFKPSIHLKKRIKENDKAFRSELESLSDKERTKIGKRYEVIKPLLVFEKVKNNDFQAFYEFMDYHKELLKDSENLLKVNKEVLINRIAKKHGISGRTVKRYYYGFTNASSEEFNGEEGLISKAGTGYSYRNDNKTLEICHPKDPEMVLQILTVRISEEYIPIIKEVIEKEYLTVKKPKKKEIYDSIAVRCSVKDLEPPYEITIYKLLSRVSEKLTDRMRIGKVADQKYQDITRGYSNKEALFPLHTVEIDHTLLDLDVLDETGQVVGRPWITLGVDVFSRMVWCFHISFEPPSANKVRKAIQQGILFKKYKEQYQTKNDWPIFGIPKTIVFDNGKEFDNYQIKRLINQTIRSNVRYRPIASPRYGGTIERLFGTLNTELIHRFEGTRKSNIRDLGEYDSEKTALLTLEDVKELLVKYITDIYHYQPHRGLPLDEPTPISRFYEGLKISGYPEFIPQEEENVFKIKLLPTKMKPYTRDGIRMDNRIYRSSDLTTLIDKREKKYMIKYDIDDISKVYLLHPETNEYVLVPCFHPSANIVERMNHFTYRLMLSEMKKKGKIARGKYASDKEILQEKADLRRRLKEKYKKGRKARQQAQRTNFQVNVTEAKPANLGGSKPKYQDLLDLALEKENQTKGD
jgi:putative transposase